HAPALSPLSWPNNLWQCPYCPYTQLNKRGPDFRRHIETHSEAVLWICCGLPVEDARRDRGITEGAFACPPLELEPRLFLLDGCKKTSSRRASLQRHLRCNEGKCFGDDRAPYQPGNRL
ncbi:hypothetical protein BD413DRAFT_443189, partial [Trametes elegans]